MLLILFLNDCRIMVYLFFYHACGDLPYKLKNRIYYQFSKLLFGLENGINKKNDKGKKSGRPMM